MKDLMIAFGEILPVETIIDQIEESIVKYKSDPTEDNVKGIEVFCLLLLSKAAAKHAGGAAELMKKTDLQERAMNLLDPTQQ